VQEIYSATNWCSISKRGYATASIKTDGTLWFAGCGCFGEFMDNVGAASVYSSYVQEYTSSTNWSQVNINRPTIAIKTDGTLWGSGSGLTGDGTAISRSSPVQEITSSTNWCCAVRVDSVGKSMAAKIDGTLWSWGNNGSYNVLLYPLACGVNCAVSSPVQEMTSHNGGWGDIHVRATNGAYIRIDAVF
jgi:alpha-tubulin suppressor-like RCC1 family protein